MNPELILAAKRLIIQHNYTGPRFVKNERKLLAVLTDASFGANNTLITDTHNGRVWLLWLHEKGYYCLAAADKSWVVPVVL